ncbi:MAG: hypothetical protein AAFV88_25280, partial [Planctomycetota bacterium]
MPTAKANDSVAMTRSTPNPYQAPLEEPARAAAVQPGDLIDSELTFDGQVSSADHVSAVKEARIRVDYRPLQWMITRTGLFIVSGIVVISLLNQTMLTWRLLVAGGVAFVSLLMLRLPTHRFHLEMLPSLQFTRGQISGRLDSETLHIKSDGFESSSPLASLVGCATSNDLLVLSFHRTYLFWYAIPFDSFQSPEKARQVATELVRFFPAHTPQPELRLLEQPEAQRVFDPQPDAIHFSGALTSQELQGSRFMRLQKSLSKRNWIRSAVFASLLLLSVVFALDAPPFAALFGGLWILIVLALRWLRKILHSKRTQVDGKTVLWRSAGWLDEYGYVSQTALGQSRFRWDYFQHHEVTSDAIALYPTSNQLVGCMIGRGQFQHD